MASHSGRYDCGQSQDGTKHGGLFGRSLIAHPGERRIGRDAETRSSAKAAAFASSSLVCGGEHFGVKTNPELRALSCRFPFPPAITSPAGTWRDLPQLRQRFGGIGYGALLCVHRRFRNGGSGPLDDWCAVLRNLAGEADLIDVAYGTFEGTFQILGRRESVFQAFVHHEKNSTFSIFSNLNRASSSGNTALAPTKMVHFPSPRQNVI